MVLSLDLHLDAAEHRRVVFQVEALDEGDLRLEVEVDAEMGLALVHVDGALVNLRRRRRSASRKRREKRLG